MKLSERHGARWLWTVAAVMPLTLVGCNNRTNAPVGNGPSENVAGERQEVSNDVAAVLQQAGLPESFQFGGRTWKGHQVHRVDADDVATSAPAGQAKSDTTTAEPPGPAGARGTAGDTSATGNTDASGNNAAGGEHAVGNFIPLPGMMVAGHQIYRRAGLDEAVTDNIYLRAEGVSAGTAAGGTGTGETGTTGTSGTTGTTGAADNNEAQVVFVEYDADESTADNADLSQVLQATNLPQTVSVSGKTFKAEEVQVYDPDVFDEVSMLPQIAGGHKVYQDDDDDHIIVMAEMTSPMPSDGKTGTPTEPSGPGGATGTGRDADDATAIAGPVFVRYEEVKK